MTQEEIKLNAIRESIHYFLRHNNGWDNVGYLTKEIMKINKLNSLHNPNHNDVLIRC